MKPSLPGYHILCLSILLSYDTHELSSKLQSWDYRSLEIILASLGKESCCHYQSRAHTHGVWVRSHVTHDAGE